MICRSICLAAIVELPLAAHSITHRQNISFKLSLFPHHAVPYIVSHLSVWLNICLISTFCSSEQEGEGYKSRAWQESRFSLNSNNTLKCDKVNSEMFAEIRSEPFLPVCIPCTARRDYFYLEDSGWYHFSKWESASAAWVIHLGSSDNFLWNMCVLFIPEKIPQHTSGD